MIFILKQYVKDWKITDVITFNDKATDKNKK
ncbi:hypothetical protein BANRA_01574 [Klebsiella pneumoniae]|nr:hypothetical protein BANRA_01574 [Klebsiella pneumoniae]